MSIRHQQLSSRFLFLATASLIPLALALAPSGASASCNMISAPTSDFRGAIGRSMGPVYEVFRSLVFLRNRNRDPIVEGTALDVIEGVRLRVHSHASGPSGP